MTDNFIASFLAQTNYLELIKRSVQKLLILLYPWNNIHIAQTQSLFIQKNILMHFPCHVTMSLFSKSSMFPMILDRNIQSVKPIHNLNYAKYITLYLDTLVLCKSSIYKGLKFQFLYTQKMDIICRWIETKDNQCL